MRGAWTAVISAALGAAVSGAVAGLSVYGDVQAIKSTVARIELRIDALAAAKVASK